MQYIIQAYPGWSLVCFFILAMFTIGSIEHVLVARYKAIGGQKFVDDGSEDLLYDEVDPHDD
jgi:hypothetical protein